MANTVFILGAGASVEAGAPLMNNFLDTAQDLLNRDAFAAYPGEEKAVQGIFTLISQLEAIHSRAPIDLNNIESLFGLIEMGNIIKKIGNINPRRLNSYKESLITMITRTIEESMIYGSNGHHFRSHESYASFAAFLKKYEGKGNSSAVLTFNYDLGLDLALEEKYRKVNYCLKKEDQEKPGLKLMKLHGSINWVVNNRNVEIVRGVRQNSENLFRISREIRIKYKKDILPVIVPPTWNKNQYHGQLSNVWNSAANELNKADNLVIIGFSIPETDSFFKYLLGLGLMNGSRIRQLVVINMDDSHEIKTRYQNLFGYGISSRLTYLPLTFSEGIDFLESHQSVSHFNVPRSGQSLSSIMY